MTQSSGETSCLLFSARAITRLRRTLNDWEFHAAGHYLDDRFVAGSPYVAQIKGVLLSVAPEANLVDISHCIAPQNIQEGAITLDDVVWRFPEKTLHIAVVDPGVGTSRRLVYVESGGQRFLAPDNGLLGRVLARHSLERAFALTEQRFWLENVSSTFTGVTF